MPGCFSCLQRAFDHRHMFLAEQFGAEHVETEITCIGRHRRRFNRRYQVFGAFAVSQQIGDGDDFQAVFGSEDFQIRQTGHFAVIIDDFADHAGRLETGQFRQINGGFGVALAFEHAAVLGNQREDVAGPVEGFGADGRIGQQLQAQRAVAGRDAGAGVFAGVDRDRERGAHRFGVAGDLQIEIEMARTLGADRCAHQAASVADHEIDRGRGDGFGRHQQIPFVFAVFVVDHDNHPA